MEQKQQKSIKLFTSSTQLTKRVLLQPTTTCPLQSSHVAAQVGGPACLPKCIYRNQEN